MTNALTEIKSLLTDRREHESAIALIDQQLAEIRRVLNGEMPERTTALPRSRGPKISKEHATQAVLAALAEREPQTINDLSVIASRSTVSVVLSRLLQQGAIVRRAQPRHGGTKQPFLYARTVEALGPAEEEVSAADDVAGGSTSAGLAADGSSSGTATPLNHADLAATSFAPYATSKRPSGEH